MTREGFSLLAAVIVFLGLRCLFLALAQAYKEDDPALYPWVAPLDGPCRARLLAIAAWWVSLMASKAAAVRAAHTILRRREAKEEQRRLDHGVFPTLRDHLALMAYDRLDSLGWDDWHQEHLSRVVGR